MAAARMITDIKASLKEKGIDLSEELIRKEVERLLKMGIAMAEKIRSLSEQDQKTYKNISSLEKESHIMITHLELQLGSLWKLCKQRCIESNAIINSIDAKSIDEKESQRRYTLLSTEKKKEDELHAAIVNMANHCGTNLTELRAQRKTLQDEKLQTECKAFTDKFYATHLEAAKTLVEIDKYEEVSLKPAYDCCGQKVKDQADLAAITDVHIPETPPQQTRVVGVTEVTSTPDRTPNTTPKTPPRPLTPVAPPAQPASARQLFGASVSQTPSTLYSSSNSAYRSSISSNNTDSLTTNPDSSDPKTTPVPAPKKGGKRCSMM